MFITASWDGGEVAVEAGEECRTLAALRARLQAALAGLDVEQLVLTVGGRCLADDEAVCGLEDGTVVELSPTVAARAVAALREEGRVLGVQEFHDTILRDDARLCELYLDAGTGWDTVWAESPLHFAASRNCVATCTLFLDRPEGAIALNKQDCEGHTPLHASCFKGHLEVTRLLLDRGATVEKNVRGDTPLHSACFYGHLEVCRLLVVRGVIVGKGSGDRTPTELAFQYGHDELGEFLRDQ